MEMMGLKAGNVVAVLDVTESLGVHEIQETVCMQVAQRAPRGLRGFDASARGRHIVGIGVTERNGLDIVNAREKTRRDDSRDSEARTVDEL
jgi:hypothetical protein